MRHHVSFAEEWRVPSMPIPEDMAGAALEDYHAGALARGEQRASERDRQGKSAPDTDRGGETAAGDVLKGYASLHTGMGLPVYVDSDWVRDVAKCGAGQPTVQPMWPLEACRGFEEPRAAASSTCAAQPRFG